MRNLTAEQADALSRHAGWVYANGILKVSDSVADQLSRHVTHVFLEGLTTLTDVGLAEKLAAKPMVFLQNLVSAKDAVVDALRMNAGRKVQRGAGQAGRSNNAAHNCAAVSVAPPNCPRIRIPAEHTPSERYFLTPKRTSSRSEQVQQAPSCEGFA